MIGWYQMFIHVQNLSKETIDTIDADTFVESFTLDPLTELLDQFSGTGKNLILARVDGNSYYYAQLLNKLLFRQLVVGSDFHILRIKACNPLTNMPIKGNIEYFLVEPVFALQSDAKEDSKIGKSCQDGGNGLEDSVGAMINLPRRTFNLCGVDEGCRSEQASLATFPALQEFAQVDRKESVKRATRKITQYIQKDAELTEQEAQKLADLENNVFILKISRNFSRRKNPTRLDPDPDLGRKKLAVAKLVEQGRQRHESAKYKTSELRDKIMILVEKSAELDKGALASVDDLAPANCFDTEANQKSPSMLDKPTHFLASYIGDENDYLSSRSMRVIFYRYALERTHYFPHHVNLKLLYKQALPEGVPHSRGDNQAGTSVQDHEDLSKMKLTLVTIGGILMLVIAIICITVPIIVNRDSKTTF